MDAAAAAATVKTNAAPPRQLPFVILSEGQLVWWDAAPAERDFLPLTFEELVEVLVATLRGGGFNCET